MTCGELKSANLDSTCIQTSENHMQSVLISNMSNNDEATPPGSTSHRSTEATSTPKLPKVKLVSPHYTAPI